MELIIVTFKLLATLNYLAVLVAAIVAFALGFVWYGPAFGKKWAGYSGISLEAMKSIPKDKMIKTYVLSFVGVFVEVTFLLFFTLLMATQFWHTALMVWFAFLLFSAMGPVFWENKPWGLFLINTSYSLVKLLLAGIVLSFFF